MRLLTLASITTAALAASALGAPAAAQTVGSAARLTHRNCAAVGAAVGCPTVFPAHGIASQTYGGGLGAGGVTVLNVAPGDRVWSNVTLGVDDLPRIAAFAQATNDVRLNANVFAFQSYVYSGLGTTPFSISGSLHIVNSSGSPLGDGLLPGGAVYSQYLGIWDPAILAGLTTAQQLSNNLFYAACDTPGVLGTANGGGDLTATGEFTFTLTTSECAPGSLTLAAGQEVLVVAGLQIPTNRGGFVDASHTFTTRFGDNLTAAQVANLRNGLQSATDRGSPFVRALGAVPEPSTWAMMIFGLLMVGGAMRRQRAAGTMRLRRAHA